MKSWEPTIGFLKQGFADYYDTVTNFHQIITWEFGRSTSSKYPIQFVKCTMTGFGITVDGYGDGFLMKKAMISAFAEAWERLWMIRVGNEKEKFGISINSSNGFAAASNNKNAHTHACNELTERALLLKAWQMIKGWEPFKVKGLFNRLLLKYFELNDWKIEFYRLGGNTVNQAIVILATHPNEGVIFDSAFIDGYKSTETKLIRSFIRMHHAKSDEILFELPEVGSPMDHAKYYRNPKYLSAFDFLKNSDSQVKMEPLDYNFIQSKLLTSVSNFPAVAVAYNSKWPELNWGKQSIGGVNPWPHPLA